jgi:pyruvate dehydrogenase E1 component alpha subunit
LEVIKAKKYATEEQIKTIDARVKNLVKECEKFAEDSDYPPIQQMYDMVYEQKDYPFLQHKL